MQQDAALGDALPDVWARARLNAADLSEVEASLVDTYLQRAVVSQVLERVQALRGIGTSQSDSEADAGIFVSQFLGNETALRWWQVRREQLEPVLPSFVPAVDAALRNLGPAQRTLHERRIREIANGPLPEGVR